jgi:hypothetical protein
MQTTAKLQFTMVILTYQILISNSKKQKEKKKVISKEQKISLQIFKKRIKHQKYYSNKVAGKCHTTY